jgi:hypothetical protein
MPIFKFVLMGVLALPFVIQAQEPAKEPTKPRVFITDSHSWEISGGFNANESGAAGRTSGGAKPQTAEIVKTFEQKCPGVTVTAKKERADFVVLIDHEGGKEFVQKDTKYVTYNKDGDSIKSGSVRSIGAAVKDSCEAITGKAEKK